MPTNAAVGPAGALGLTSSSPVFMCVAAANTEEQVERRPVASRQARGCGEGDLLMCRRRKTFRRSSPASRWWKEPECRAVNARGRRSSSSVNAGAFRSAATVMNASCSGR